MAENLGFVKECADTKNTAILQQQQAEFLLNFKLLGAETA